MDIKSICDVISNEYNTKGEQYFNNNIEDINRTIDQLIEENICDKKFTDQLLMFEQSANYIKDENTRTITDEEEEEILKEYIKSKMSK